MHVLRPSFAVVETRFPVESIRHLLPMNKSETSLLKQLRHGFVLPVKC